MEWNFLSHWLYMLFSHKFLQIRYAAQVLIFLMLRYIYNCFFLFYMRTSVGSKKKKKAIVDTFIYLDVLEIHISLSMKNETIL